MKAIDIAWLAGLVEGEGCLSLHSGKYPALAIRMSDEDVIRRAANLLGTRITGPYKTRENYKPTWLCQVNGSLAASWIMTLYVLLGERRQAKAREIIEAWKKLGSNRVSSKPRAQKGSFTPAGCHPDRPNRAHGMCKECYMKAYRNGAAPTYKAV
jgi:hypothetical protein